MMMMLQQPTKPTRPISVCWELYGTPFERHIPAKLPIVGRLLCRRHVIWAFIQTKRLGLISTMKCGWFTWSWQLYVQTNLFVSNQRRFELIFIFYFFCAIGKMARVRQWTKSSAVRWSWSNNVRYHQRWIQWFQHWLCACTNFEDFTGVHRENQRYTHTHSLTLMTHRNTNNPIELLICCVCIIFRIENVFGDGRSRFIIGQQWWIAIQ